MVRTRTNRNRNLIARAAGLGIILALAPIATAAPGARSPSAALERGGGERVTAPEARRGHRRGHRAEAGTLCVDGRRYRIDTRRPHREVARAFRRCGYPARVDYQRGRSCVIVKGCADAHWRPGAYDGGFRAGRRGLVFHLQPRQRRCR